MSAYLEPPWGWEDDFWGPDDDGHEPSPDPATGWLHPLDTDPTWEPTAQKEPDVHQHIDIHIEEGDPLYVDRGYRPETMETYPFITVAGDLQLATLHLPNDDALRFLIDRATRYLASRAAQGDAA